MATNLVNLNSAQPPLNSNVVNIENIAPEYLLQIDVHAPELRQSGIWPIVVVLPESYTLAVAAQYDTPLANIGLQEGADKLGQSLRQAVPAGSSLSGLAQLKDQLLSGMGGTLEKAFSLFGNSTKMKYQSIQVYKGGQAMTLSLDLVFNVTKDAELDIKNKILELMKLAVPIEGTVGMKVPGKILFDETNSRTVSLKLGTFLYLKECLVKSVNADLKTICGISGIPHSVTVQATFETCYSTVTDVDLDEMFGI